MRRLNYLAIGLFLFAAGAYGAETCSKVEPSRPRGALPMCIAIDAAATDTSSAIIDTYGYPYLSMSIEANGATTATVNILCREAEADQWHTCADDVVNPDATDRVDQAINLSRAFQYQITTTGHVAGAITVYFTRGDAR